MSAAICGDGRPPERARKVGTQWLRGFAWDWFWTLTFEKSVSWTHARTALKCWLRGLARDTLHEHFRVVWVIEQRRLGEMVHVHLLIELWDDAVLDVRAAQRAWRMADPFAGHPKPIPYDPTRASSDERSVEHYLSKWTQWDMSIVCPRARRCRRAGCVYMRGPWI